MSYGLIYTTYFNDFNGNGNTFEIYKKDFTGDPINIVCGSGAVTLSYGPDEPKAKIKGLALKAEIINVQGSFPISNLYSIEDDTFLVKFYVGAGIKFIGYLVQDDCSEIQVDFTHTLEISATDNLGLLKDISLDKSQKAFTLLSTNLGVPITTTSPGTIVTTDIIASLISVGNKIIISGGTVDGDYVVTDVSITGSVGTITVADTISTATLQTVTMYVYDNNIQGRMTLANILKIALAPTALEIGTFIYTRLKPKGGLIGRLLEDVFLDTSTFLKNDVYDNCWDVIEVIMKRFGLTMFQDNGHWVIVNWNEARENFGILYGYEYDNDMNYISDAFIDPNTSIGNGSDIETGLNASIERPLKFVKETFDYKQPDDILRNASFSKLGPLLRSYADGTDTIYEYGMADWGAGYDFTTGGNGYIASSAQRFIRVRRNAGGVETDRLGVIKGNSGFSDPAAAESFPIEVRPGDRIKYSFDIRTKESLHGIRYIGFLVEIITTAYPTPRSLSNKRLNNDGIWFSWGDPQPPGVSLNLHIPNGDNANQWHTVSVESDEIPVAGLLRVKLAQGVPGNSSTKETYYKNIRFDITRSVAGSAQVIGQTHQQTQSLVIRNAKDEDINLDDSPSSIISGTLMLGTFTGPLRDLTYLWQTGVAPAELRLGQIITRYEIFQRRKDRSKLEGTILRSNLSPLSIMQYLPMPGLNFIFGKLEINYKTGRSDATMWELFDDDEVEYDLVEDYAFRYIYNTK